MRHHHRHLYDDYELSISMEICNWIIGFYSQFDVAAAAAVNNTDWSSIASVRAGARRESILKLSIYKLEQLSQRCRNPSKVAARRRSSENKTNRKKHTEMSFWINEHNWTPDVMSSSVIPTFPLKRKAQPPAAAAAAAAADAAADHPRSSRDHILPPSFSPLFYTFRRKLVRLLPLTYARCWIFVCF